MQISLRKELNDLKRKKRKQTKYGYYYDWPSADFNDLMLSVPLFSKKDDELLFFETYMAKDSLPKNKQYLWTE